MGTTDLDAYPLQLASELEHWRTLALRRRVLLEDALEHAVWGRQAAWLREKIEREVHGA